MPCEKIDGYQIYYELIGDDDGRPPVVLHHGFAQRIEDWKTSGWTEALAGRRLLVIDALGHGQSDKPRGASNYTVERRAGHVARVAEAARLEKFVYFGFSMGGRIGFQLAADSPRLLSGLIVGGMHAFAPGIDSNNLKRRINVLRSPRWKMIERAVGVDRENSHNDPEALAASTEAIMQWQGVEDRLSACRVKSMAFCGDQDSLLEYAKQSARLIPGCEFTELPETNHSASFYRSQEARSAVRRFLDRLPAR